jgi:hypothetical protein
LGLRNLPVGSPQLAWGIFDMGLVVAPLLSLIAEFIALVGFGFLYIFLNPGLLDRILELSEIISLDSPELLIDQFKTYIMQPSTLVIVLLFGAVIVPLLEELFKPVGVWLLVGRNPSPAQGFAAGLLSGAGYALFENFSLGAAAGEDWAMVVVARIGTSLIHIVTAGLMGWALSLAWTEKQILRLALSYLAAVAIHALWNGSVIITAVLELLGSDVEFPDAVHAIGTGAPFLFIILILGCFVLLLGFNASLRRAIIPPAQLQPVMKITPEKELGKDGSYYDPD